MKIYRMEQESVKRGRKPKTPRVDPSIVSKIGSGIYHCKGVKDVAIKVGFTNGTVIAYNRNEDEDDYEERKKNRSEHEEC